MSLMTVILFSGYHDDTSPATRDFLVKLTKKAASLRSAAIILNSFFYME